MWVERVRRYREKQSQRNVTQNLRCDEDCNALQVRYSDDSHAVVTRDIERDSHACHAVTVPKPYIDDLDPTTSILNARAQ